MEMTAQKPQTNKKSANMKRRAQAKQAQAHALP